MLNACNIFISTFRFIIYIRFIVIYPHFILQNHFFTIKNDYKKVKSFLCNDSKIDYLCARLFENCLNKIEEF